MNISELIKNGPVFLDGAMGTLLQKKGLDPGDPPEAFNLTNPDAVKEVHMAYLNAGSDIILTNTFGANRLNYDPDEAEKIIREGIRIAKDSIACLADNVKERYAALDIGPSGHLMEPFGDLSFDEAIDVFSDMVKAGVKYGADLIVIETMSDISETKAALLAAKENSSLPVFVSNTYQASGKLMTGADPLCMISMLEGMGADAIGMNCSLGPEQLKPVVGTYLKYASVPVLVKPNAGMPRMENDKVVYDITAETFAEITSGFAVSGAGLLGGCCGTNPEYIGLLSKTLSGQAPAPAQKDIRTFVSSYTHAIDVNNVDPASIPKLEGNTVDDLVDSAYDLEHEADIIWLDLSGSAESPGFAEEAVFEVQSAVKNPLVITADNAESLEAALRVYKGRPAVRPAEESENFMARISPVIEKYGAVIL